MALSTKPTLAEAVQPATDINSSQSFEVISARVKRALPPGSSLDEVESYLRRNNVEHSVVYGKIKTVYAIVRHIRGGSFLVDKSARIIIHLDTKDKITDVKVEPGYTGP